MQAGTEIRPTQNSVVSRRGAPLRAPGSHRTQYGAVVEGTREGTEPLSYEAVQFHVGAPGPLKSV